MIWNRRNGLLVGGHLRFKVMKDMGVKRADVVVVDYDDDTHYRRMMAANEQQGMRDTILMAALVEDMRTRKVDTSLTGLSSEQLDRLMAQAKADADRAFLNEMSKGGEKKERLSTAGMEVETFPFVVVLDAGQHAKIMKVVGLAQKHFKTEGITDTTMRVFDFFERHHKKSKS